MAKDKKYKMLVDAAGIPAGTIVSGPAVEVLVANGKAVEIVDAMEAVPTTKKAKEAE